MSARRFVLLFALLAGVRIAVVPIALTSDATAPSRYRILPGDARRFYKIASEDGRSYRDFEVEYPPVMVAAIDVIDGGTIRSTTVRLMWSQLVIDLAIAAVVAWSWGRRAGIAYLVLGDRLQPLQILGAAVIIAGIIAVQAGNRRSDITASAIE